MADQHVFQAWHKAGLGVNDAFAEIPETEETISTGSRRGW